MELERHLLTGFAGQATHVGKQLIPKSVRFWHHTFPVDQLRPSKEAVYVGQNSWAIAISIG